MRKLALTAAIAFVTTLTGCASFIAPGYSPDYPTVDRLKATPIAPLAVGTFQPRAPDAKVNRISLRGASMTAQEGSFAQYLENAIRSDLIELKALDPNADIRIDATLTKNDINVAGISTGTGVIEMQLQISRKGVATLQKAYLATIQFDSSFAGAVAIPKGQSEYPNLVRTLLKQIYSDQEFLAAVSK
jgi:hypothetical protein